MTGPCPEGIHRVRAAGGLAGILPGPSDPSQEAPRMIEQRGAPTSEPLPAFRSKLDAIRPTYGFEDVSLAPGTSTIEPNDVELGQTFCGIDLAIPVLASAMDAVVDPAFAGTLARLGGLPVLNLEGVQGRHDDPGGGRERPATPP